ncbi:response regulator [bacterium]|nr:response regulator [candidate division CSSED10-310 bacterium]
MAKILVVDDDPDVVEAIEILLTSAGHEVGTAGNREEGMKAVESFNPDMCILDVMMEEPDDGFVMAQALRRQKFTKPILILTSIGKVTGMDFGRDDAMVPVDDFQEKPIKPADLLNKVNGLLNKAGGA